MPNSGGVVSSSLDTPRSPVSISTDSSRRGSLRPSFHAEKELELPTPFLSHSRLTRKRAAALDTEAANLTPSVGELALNSARSSSGPPTSNLTREQVCLCQPDPKIPRPRNAFILYRQHYQAQVVAQNPGLANPEISKIIGEQWREQAPEVKNDWKRLAEEEKQRHQRQYPGYRYQPRRAGKTNSARPISTTPSEDLIRCPKCQGRYISTPSTPLTPFTPAFAPSPRNERFIPPFTASSSAPITQGFPIEHSRFQQMYSTRMDSPRTVAPHQQSQRRHQSQRPQPLLHTHREHEEDVEMLTPSPDPKRRRFNQEPPQPQRGYASSPVPFQSPRPFPHQTMSMSAQGYRPQQLPGPGMIVRQGPIGPPPQQSPMIQEPRYPYPSRSSTYEDSLRLPPLQTQMTGSTPITTQRSDLRPDHRDSQAMGVEAMIMSIPLLNKIKVLRKIAPPLRPPGVGSPAPQIRGAVVAIEGADKALIAEIGEFINEYLNKDNSCAVQTWTASKPKSKSPSSIVAITESVDSRTYPMGLSPIGDARQSPFNEYLSTISNWHRKSLEITDYITMTPPTSAIDPSLSQPAPSSRPQTRSTAISVSSEPTKLLPIALLPNGFSLTTSDEFSRRIHIMDDYAPVDHWQWMATLWRGIIGPDVTVFARKVSAEELDKWGSVEMHTELGSIVLRVGEGGKMDEKTARRLGFEVLEMARGAENARKKD